MDGESASRSGRLYFQTLHQQVPIEQEACLDTIVAQRNLCPGWESIPVLPVCMTELAMLIVFYARFDGEETSLVTRRLSGCSVTL
jgi:hypothetical protein